MQTRISTMTFTGAVFVILLTGCFPIAWGIATLGGGDEAIGPVIYLPVLLVAVPLFALKETMLSSLRDGGGTGMARLVARLVLFLLSLSIGGLLGVFPFALGGLLLWGKGTPTHLTIGICGVLAWGIVLLVDLCRLVIVVIDMFHSKRPNQ